MKKVLVIGYSGLIASRIIQLISKDFTITAIDEKTLDITEKNAVDSYFQSHQFDIVINFAAYTNVDGAEKERGNENGIVWKLNVLGTQNLCNVCEQKNIFFAHISTDFVFSGSDKNPGPYLENSKIPNNQTGISWYGWTKNRAEYLLQNSSCRNAIIRIAYPFYAAKYDLKLDFAKNYLKLYDDNKLFPVFSDQVISVLNVDDMVLSLIKIFNDEMTGIFHLVSQDTTTPFDFVEYLLRKSKNASNVVQTGSMKEFLKVGNRIPRPRLGGLKTEATESKLGMKFKTWREMVDDFVEKL